MLIWALLRTRTRRLSSHKASISYLWKQCQILVVEKKKGNGKGKTNDINGWLIQERPLHINRVWTRKWFLQMKQQISSRWNITHLRTLARINCACYIRRSRTCRSRGCFWGLRRFFFWSSCFQRAVWWVRVTLGFQVQVRFKDWASSCDG